MIRVSTPVLFRRIFALGLTLALGACGGGGSGDPSPATDPGSTSSGFAPSASLANQCVPDTEKKWVRSYLDEVYLWSSEVIDVDPAQYATTTAYFNALRVRTPDANGQPKDRFSAVVTTAEADRLQASSPEAAMPLAFDPAPVSAIDPNLRAQAIPLVKTVSSGAGRKVGYILFNDHAKGAQDELIAAFTQLKTAQVQDLVLDMRYNTGGFLYVALAAASMVAGPSAEGKVFEKLRYNEKRTALSDASTILFSSKVQVSEPQSPRGAALPQLNLPRLYVLSSASTCSASESIINDLRGIDIDVVLVGGATCGKPYGFTRKDNCGLAFFPIEFQGVNAKGYGDYTTGIKATCEVADNPTVALGSTGDPLLAGALRHIDTGACPPRATAGSAPSVQSGVSALLARDLGSAPARAGAPTQSRPDWQGRILSPGVGVSR